MKKISLYITLALAGLFMGSCSDDYTDWANPQTNAQESAITIPGFTASAVTTIDLAAVKTDSVATFTLSSAKLPDGFSLDKARIELTPVGIDNAKTTTLSTSVSGATLAADLQSLVTKTFGMRPTTRTFNGHVYLNAIKDGQACLIDAGMIVVNIIPVAPEIETAYYITGGINEWNNNDKTYAVTNSGADVYEDPVFTITLTAEQVGTGFDFKLTPLSGIGGDWTKCITAASDGTAGKLSNNNAGGNLKVEAVAGAKIYKLTFNMLDQTWSVKALSFQAYAYEIGNESGWATSHALYGANYDGKYEGFYYLDGDFKFKPNADNWDDDYEYVSEGKLIQTGGPNVPNPGAGFYKINLDEAALTYSLTKVNYISIIGTVNGNWNTDTDLTYNTATGAWETTATLSAGDMKFRLNHDWAISWGGNGSTTAFDNLTSNNSANLAVSAGTYKIQLYISYEGNNKVVMTKQ